MGDALLLPLYIPLKRKYERDERKKQEEESKRRELLATIEYALNQIIRKPPKKSENTNPEYI